jgi:uncharacterized LabA/DUF88 family protein
VWSAFANLLNRANCDVVRSFYYTSTRGDGLKIEEVERQLKQMGFQAPRVFSKSKSRGSKRVDISLATDMLTHAFRKNFDFAILVAGDEDYVPLVQAVMSEGLRVIVWFIEDGLSPILAKEADHFFNLGGIFLQPNDYLSRHLSRSF